MKRAIVIRYGGFGDALQAASILPGLKEQGWHVTFDCSEQGFELLKTDPCVDALLLTPYGSVPDKELGEYWNARTNGFHRVINLCESVENASLMRPNTLGFFRDDETRRRMYGDTNYVEHIHKIAGVPGPFVPRFCLTADELREGLQKVRWKKTITLGLAGSSEYKIWPHAPGFVAEVVKKTDFNIHLVGSQKDAKIAQDIIEFIKSEDLPTDRVFDATSLPVREAFALAWCSDVIVSPETGVANAVATSVGRKVILLSHSSPRNLTQHWTNTVAIEPRVACHPCHRLHQTTKFCPRGPSGAFAACAESIDPGQVLAACLNNSEA